MKFLSFIFISLFSLNSHSESKATEYAYELSQLSIEYSEISKKGWLRPLNCSYCTKAIYNFDQKLIVYKNGEPSSIQELINKHYSAFEFTVLVDISSETISRIFFRIKEQ